MAPSGLEIKLVSCVGYALRLSKSLQKMAVANELNLALVYLVSEMRSLDPSVAPSWKRKVTVCLESAIPQPLPCRDPRVDAVSETSAADLKKMSMKIDTPEHNVKEAMAMGSTQETRRSEACHEQADDRRRVLRDSSRHSPSSSPRSPKSLVRHHVEQAASAEEAVRGLMYLRDALRTSVETAPEGPQRAWALQVFREIEEQLLEHQDKVRRKRSSPGPTVLAASSSPNTTSDPPNIQELREHHRQERIALKQKRREARQQSLRESIDGKLQHKDSHA